MKNDAQERMSKTFIMYSILLIGAFSFIFIEFADEVIEMELKSFDNPIIQYIHGLRTPLLGQIMAGITSLGSATGIMMGMSIALIVLFINRQWWEGLFLIVAVSGSSLLNYYLKWMFKRDRPTFNPLITEDGYSFPSGHSMVSFSFLGILAYLITLMVKKKRLKVLIMASFFFIVFLIGFSRIYLGVHYPSDVIAGFAAGGAWLVICIVALKFKAKI
ncbi:phosphatase PAP2 family protein [Peribacillus frigoritolerans]|uniref:phosphatase PAP2 family protein n=1 Tax=Peribacillus frigoritolerans TaxID=450367 RepID=UPI00105A30CE|nr:phosphatase PAP2 family protein [Peribacillus frigoritolerans]TDL80841.1 phosphatase PAP2 family protein [Peribacillus frigoritolerans]